MRKNLPVTDREKTFGSNTKLISVTDTQGTILECNDAFVEVSGFEKHELNRPEFSRHLRASRSTAFHN
jgi:aerotaxis receptor